MSDKQVAKRELQAEAGEGCSALGGGHSVLMKMEALTVTEVLEEILLAGEIQLHFDVDSERGHLARLQRKLSEGFF